MVKVNFLPTDFKRDVAQESALVLKNRYFEQNPSLTDDGAALIARPGLKKFVDVGQGPIRGIQSTAGAFNGDLFVASYDSMYRVTYEKDITLIKQNLFNPEKGFVKIQITANIGETPEYMFFTDGRTLFVYLENGFATNTLTGTAANADQVRIGDTYYQFTNGAVDAGTPDGSSGNPWLVALGASNAEAFANFAAAVDDTGEQGTQYSTSLSANPDVRTSFLSSNTVVVLARVAGLLANGVVTTETGASLDWTEGGTLTGGGAESCTQVQTPDDVGVLDIAVLNSYLIVIPAQGEGINGRFYWIEPGEVTIDPLNFATAERNPDGISQVLIQGDQFLLLGDSTVEVWYIAGGFDTPMQRVQGVVYDRGAWNGSGVKINDSVVFVDAEGGVFANTGPGVTRISTPQIEEQMRASINRQQALTASTL